MAEQKERQLWTLLRNGTKKIQDIHWTRIENMVDSGTPDTWGVHQGIYFPIELKVVEKGLLHFRPAQINWMLKHLIAEGRPYILYRNGSNIIGVTRFNMDVYNKLETKGKYQVIAPAGVIDQTKIFTKPFNYREIVKELIRE